MIENKKVQLLMLFTLLSYAGGAYILSNQDIIINSGPGSAAPVIGSIISPIPLLAMATVFFVGGWYMTSKQK